MNSTINIWKYVMSLGPTQLPGTAAESYALGLVVHCGPQPVSYIGQRAEELHAQKPLVW